MSEQDHFKFLSVMERLRDWAKDHGETALAEALSECAFHASGGSQCPMGQLILDDYLRTGKRPGAASASATGTVQDSSRRGPAHAQATPPEREERISRILNRVFSILQREAKLTKDAAYLEALQACAHFRETGEPLSQSGDVCPLYRLMRAAKPAS